MDRFLLWPTTEGEVARMGKLSASPTTEDPQPAEMNIGVGPGEHGVLQSDAGEGLPFFTVYDHVNDCRLAFVSVTSVSVGTSGERSSLIDSTGTSYVFFDGLLSPDLTTDLDTGAEAADTWYAVIVEWEAADPTNIKATFTVTPAAPTLSGSRDKFRRVGWVRNDASSSLIDFQTVGVGRYRSILWRNAALSRLVLTAGSATVATAIACSSLVPPTSQAMYASLDQDGIPIVNFRLTAAGPIIASLKKVHRVHALILLDSSQQIFYDNAAPAGSVDVGVRGYVDEV